MYDASHHRHSPEAALRLLPPYIATISCIMLITHIMTAIVPNVAHVQVAVGSLSTAMPAGQMLTLALGALVVAILLLILIIRYGKAFDRLRFGALVAHTSTFLVVMGSNFIHLFIDLASHVGVQRASILSAWFGPTIAMGTFWMIGLFLHLMAAVLSRGIESTRV